MPWHGRPTQVLSDLTAPRRRALWQGNRELIAAVATGDRACGQSLADDVANRAHGFGTGQMPMLVVQRLQAIDVEYEHGDRRVLMARGPHHPHQVGFERAQVVQSGEIVGQGELAEAVTIMCQLRRDQAHSEKELATWTRSCSSYLSESK